ncbi:MAG: serine carboxypeptidase [Alphaproteobacteria bacterium]|nr:MAG: serine carboxypeptidase [Alphaproteobacteria bacterium]
MKTEKILAQAWKDLVIAVVGGDEREQEIARLAAATGASVRAFGFPGADAVAGVAHADTAHAALQDAHVALFPIPGMTMDGAIFATEKIVPDQALLSVMAKGAHIVLGKADNGLRAAAKTLGIGLHEYEHDKELMLLRAPAIVEGALQHMIANTAFTIHMARVCVVGQGNIGTVLTRTLIALGARVTVAARNPVQRASAYTMGADTMELDDLETRANTFDIICSTVPAPLVTAAVIDRMPENALVIDLSAPPGGCDLDHARKSGRAGIWARALGRRAPITVGASQWMGIERIIRDVMQIKD